MSQDEPLTLPGLGVSTEPVWADRLRVGAWRIEASRNLLVRGGREERLEPKVMALLLALAARGGEVATRDELFAAVWPDVVVGDDALTMAVSKLRRALGDDRRGMRYIETIPKTGYRLVAAVESIDSETIDPEVIDPEAIDTEAIDTEAVDAVTGDAVTGDAAPRSIEHGEPRTPTEALVDTLGAPRVSTPPLEPDEPTRSRPLRGRGLAAVLTVALLAAILWAAPPARQPPSDDTVPTALLDRTPEETVLTSMPGSELLGRLSPDGRWLTFARSEPGERGLYVQRRDRGIPQHILRAKGRITAPTFSPDGESIAALDCRIDGESSCELLVVARDASTIESILTYRPSPLNGIDWSPTANLLAIARQPAPGHPVALALVDLETGAVRPLTEPPAGQLGDARPVFSRDGRRIAFTRGPDLVRHELFVVDVDGGTPHRVPMPPSRIWGITWGADDGELIVASNRDGPFRLYRVDIASGTARWIPTGARDVRFPWLVGDRLLYEAFRLDADLWRIQDDGSVERLHHLASTRWDIAPRHAPDDRRLAFVSTRTGRPQIWLDDPRSGLRMLGDLDVDYLGRLEWSPDGTRIATEAMTSEGLSIVLLDVASETVTHRPFAASGPLNPRWSRDGRSLYVGSDRCDGSDHCSSSDRGPWRIWRVPVDGGDPVPVTRGIVAEETVDGGALVLQRRRDRELWHVPLDRDGHAREDEARLVAGDLAPSHPSNWLVTHAGLLFPTVAETPLESDPTDRRALDLVLVDPTTGTRRTVTTLHGSLFGTGLSATRDADEIVVSLRERMESELRMIEDFR
ncbi:MAG: winged helix-turn-helix domain-containing protein [Acidobacteriota bacterium]